MKIETLLYDEIESEFGELKKISVGTEEYDKAVAGISKLVDRALEIEKMKADKELENEKLVSENIQKAEELELEKKDRTIKNILTGLGIALPLSATIWGTIKSLEFEKEGTITTIMGRGFITKLLPKK